MSKDMIRPEANEQLGGSAASPVCYTSQLLFVPQTGDRNLMSSNDRYGGLSRALAAIGPGIVVAGSVIGSGELINTPIQAAKFGFVLLWIVLLSCVIKYFLQVEIARHCLVHNRTTFESLNRIPGPHLGPASWVVVLYVIGYFFAMLTMIGIIGALGGLMHGIYPLASSQAVSTRIWGTIMVLITIGLLWNGWYRQLELLVMVLVGGFSVSVAVGVLLVQGTPFRISASEVLSGLTFRLGDSYAGAAFAVISLMGALGVAANELLMYPYWILEKGYARELGDSQSAGWADRVKHRVRWIWIDAGFSTALATLVTAAFFLLGAAILFRKGITPKGPEVVDQISSVFTETWGEWSKVIFVIGAFCTLYSTLVVVAAASGRMAADLLGTFGLIDRNDQKTVHRWHQWVQTFWLVALLAVFVLVPMQPEQYVQSGHYVLGAFLTPLLMFCICWLAFQTDRRVRMSTWTAIALITSVAIIFGCVVVNVVLPWLPNPS
jgi:Mn2+/Fe2+ NRAMP family transporter